jgi:hypothetical protein
MLIFVCHRRKHNIEFVFSASPETNLWKPWALPPSLSPSSAGMAVCAVILMFCRLQAGLRCRRASELLGGSWSMTLSPSITINRAFHEILRHTPENQQNAKNKSTQT